MSISKMQEGGMIWQGFNYKWGRNVLGIFETPHRLGSFVSKVFNTTVSPNNSLRSFIDVGFTPGVNGDFSYPENYYSMIFANNTIDNTTNIYYFEEDSVNINFTDYIIKDDNNEAKTYLNFSKTFEPSGVSGNSTGFDTTNFQVILNGISLKMSCDKSKGICNSEGIWPELLDLSIVSCVNKNGSNGTLIDCNFNFNLERGSAPYGGSGKALSDVMNYKLELNLLFIYKIGTKFEAHEDNIETDNEIDIANKFAVQNITTDGITGTQKVVGLTGFQFRLYGTHSDRGRYIEQIAFAVRNSENTDKLDSYRYLTSVYSPYLTTYSSRIDMKLKTKVLFFDNNVEILEAQPAVGRICVNDWTTAFWCFFKRMPAQTEDHLVVDYQEQVNLNHLRTK